MVGLELADFLSERGRFVTVLEEGGCFATQMAIPRRWRVLYVLRERGVSLLTDVKVKEIMGDAVEFITNGDELKTVEADTVILATGTVPDQDLFDKVKALCPEVHLLGDCNKIGYIKGSLADAVNVATAI